LCKIEVGLDGLHGTPNLKNDFIIFPGEKSTARQKGP
jgi:hypothetical protein